MLAKPFDIKHLKKWNNIFVQYKLDGQRAIWTGKSLLSRTGKVINSVDHIIDKLESLFRNQPLDGELYLHGKSLQEILSDTRRTVNINENKIQYHIYDIPIKAEFKDRLDILNSLKFPKEFIKVDTWTLNKIDYLDNIGFDGYEGLILRNGAGYYKFGKRSSDLLKFKPFQDDEFEIVGIEELLHKEKVILDKFEPGAKEYADGTFYRDGKETRSGKMGKLICRTEDGKEFGVGTGFSDEQRKEYWKNPPIGEVLTVKFQKYTDDGIPFLPVGITIRDYE